jgi:RNA polymerase sigma factor (sigma-70 family)
VPDDTLLAAQHEGRRRFLELVAALRPELHRYCARMTGSIADGEDIVQDTLARAYYLLPEMNELPPFRPWLFRIAHNRALDHLRRYEAKMSAPLDEVRDTVDPAPEAGDVIAHQQAVRLAVTRFVELAPAQRSCVILKDVLGHTLEEIGVLLELSLPAVKAALHRGRVRLHELAEAPPAAEPPLAETSPAVARYVALFNARDWDGVRAMLAEDVQLDLVSRAQRAGRAVGNYLSNYERLRDWHLAPAWLEGREVIAVFRAPEDARPGYFIELTVQSGQVRLIRDFRYVPYVMQDAAVVLA